jgi:hypothetical protein
MEEEGSEDSLGRAIWALGTCMGRFRRRDLQYWAAHLFDQAIGSCADTTSPRAWAFALVGIHEYFRRLSGVRQVDQLRDELTSRLLDLFERHATEEWMWFEEVVAYANAKLSHALILSGRWANRHEATDAGLRSLQWLVSIQKTPEGHFRPIGSLGFYQRGEARTDFDQQPIEAQATVSACIEAYRSTQDEFWLEEARTAFEWFLGRNDLGLPLYDSTTAGCCDGLHPDRVNRNQGAESTLAFLLALAEMTLLENSLASFETATDDTVSPSDPDAS